MSTTDLLDDYLDLAPFAAEVGRNPRTIRRWTQQPSGLPFTRIGNRILIHLPTAKQWIYGRMHRPSPPRTTRRRRQHEHLDAAS